jgi:hypothetical protein
VVVDDDLRAVRHRIKNDLQLVGSLLRLEIAATTDAAAKSALESVDRRVLAIMLSYVNDASGVVPLRGYLEELCRAVPGVTLTCDERSLSPTPLTRIGLIVSEIVSTAGSAVDVRVTGDSKLCIEASRARKADGDPGVWLVGFPRDIVTSLARQLRGTFEEPDRDRIVVTVTP